MPEEIDLPLTKIDAESSSPLLGSTGKYRWAEQLGVIALAFLVGTVGLLPHLAYSWQLGEITYFHYAADEEWYAFYALSESVSPWRKSYLFAALVRVCGGNLQYGLITADFIFPSLCFLSAWWFCRLLLSRWVAAVGALFILTLQEWASLGSLAVTVHHPAFSLTHLRGMLSPCLLSLVPDYTTYYFNLFRSPEPQISWIGFFIILRLVSHAWLSDNRGRWMVFRVVGACVLLPFIYTYCMIGLGVWLSLLAVAAFPRDRYLSLALGGGLVLSGAIFYILLATSPDLQSIQMHTVFASRLPVLVPSEAWGILLLVAMFVAKQRNVLDQREYYLGATATLVPWVLMNYQIILGLMVSARDWERYINYLMLGVATTILIKGVLRHSKQPTGRMVFVPTVILLLYLVAGQWNTWAMFKGYNDTATGVLQALSDATVLDIPQRRLVVEDVMWVPLLDVRSNRRLPALLRFDDLNLAPARVPLGAGDGKLDFGRRHLASVFDFFDRTGKSPEDVRTLLLKELDPGPGFFLAWFFHFRDWWPPATDSRVERSDQIMNAIPKIVAEYEQYLQSNLPLTDAYVVSKRPTGELDANPRWSLVPLKMPQGKSDAGYVTYFQTPKIPNGVK